jgi:diguanylate cyclase (GGDEF)-like protein
VTKPFDAAELLARLRSALAEKTRRDALAAEALTDILTGLINRRGLEQQLDQLLAHSQRVEEVLSLIMFDADRFKTVNDTYGHDIGDVVIRGLADILKRQKRNTDVVARFGGEEFVVLCEQTDEKGAMLLAERIREDLEKTSFRTPRGSMSVTCSVGVATFPEAGTAWETVFKSADEALYVSKRSGRNRCTAWHAPRSSAGPRQRAAS